MATTGASESNYPMNSGDHPHSYAQNSFYQRGATDAARELISRAIAENLDPNSSPPPRPFRIADFGCSIGPNTFVAVQNIVESVESKLRADREFHVFFCDHVGNDFNTLFRTLDPSRRYFAAGVPGSFHHRLLPASTLDVAHSAYAVHWLSRVPKAVEDRDSPAFNGGSFHCIGTGREEVTAAYWDQFCGDMELFLSARAAEIVPGGLLLIVSPVLPNERPVHLLTGNTIFYEVLRDCLEEMVTEGSVSEERVESFNVPMYFASTDQFRTVIEQNGKFSIEQMEEFPHPTSHNYAASPEGVPRFASMIRATVEALFKQHFGDALDVDNLFRRYSDKLAEPRRYAIFREQVRKRMEVFILLKRK